MAETFLSGFAQGYIQERDRRLQEQSRKDEMKFKYKMDALTEQRDLRTKKKQQESEWARQAADLAKITGDDDSSGVYFNELKNGVGYETLQKRINEGSYIKNPNYTKPTQTVKVPSAVTATRADALPGTDTPEWEKTNREIDELDPNLRMQEDTDDTSTDFDSNKDAYVFKPTKEFKIGEYDQALYDLQKAKDAKDPVAIRDAERKIEIHQRVLTEKAVTEARAQGKDVGTYLSLDDKGRVIGQVPGRMVTTPDGREVLMNIADPRNPVEIQGDVRAVTEDDIKRYNALGDKYSERSKNFQSASGAYITALQTSSEITTILEADPGAGTYVGTGLQLVEQLQGNVRAAYESLNGMETNIQAKIESGDMTGIESMVEKYTEEAQKFSSSFLSEGNRNRALNAAKVRGLKVSAAYQFAVAQGVSTGKLSNQDFENNFQQIGASDAAEATIAKLQQTASSAFTRLASAQADLDRDPAVKDFEQRMGVKTNFRARRIGDQIMDLDIDENKKRLLMEYNNSIAGGHAAGTQRAVDSAKISEQLNADESGYVKGQIYPGKGGKKYRYMGGGKDPKNFKEVIE